MKRIAAIILGILLAVAVASPVFAIEPLIPWTTGCKNVNAGSTLIGILAADHDDPINHGTYDDWCYPNPQNNTWWGDPNFSANTLYDDIGDEWLMNCCTSLVEIVNETGWEMNVWLYNDTTYGGWPALCTNVGPHSDGWASDFSQLPGYNDTIKSMKIKVGTDVQSCGVY